MGKQVINYEKRMVLYIDILGFQDAVEESVNNEDKLQIIYKALLHIYTDRKTNYEGPLHGSQFGTHVSVFSDNLVLSEPFDLMKKGSWFSFIMTAYYIINEILWDGFLVRGAITIGDLYHDEHVVFGPALNQAYNLESKVSIYPRVIITNEDFELGLQNFLHDIDEDKKFLSRVTAKDVDGFIFINNLSNKHDFDDDDIYLDLMKKAKSIITDGLKFTNPRIKAKYEWLKSKFNYNCDLFNNFRILQRIV